MNYFTYEKLLAIHDKVLAVSGGMAGVKDEGLLRGPVEFIQDDNYYPTFSDKITHLVYSLVKNHGFNDGNKRTALAAGGLLLMLNGYDDFIGYYFLMFEQVMVLVADNGLSKVQLSVLVKDMVEFGELSESSKVMIVEALADHLLL